jgi:hypothetical protein
MHPSGAVSVFFGHPGLRVEMRHIGKYFFLEAVREQ